MIVVYNILRNYSNKTENRLMQEGENAAKDTTLSEAYINKSIKKL